MEIPFYHDDSMNFYPVPISNSTTSNNMMKQNLNLNISDQPGSHVKSHQLEEDGLLTSSDLGLLKLASPELERLIIQSNGLVTTTPSSSQFLYPRLANEEQEFADGFVQALEDLHKQNQLSKGMKVSSVTTGASIHPSVPSDTPIYVNLNSYPSELMGSTINYCTEPVSYPPLPHNMEQQQSVFHTQRLHALKDEPQIVPEGASFGESPPLSPIDMDNQERIKAERKKLRNRIAASKCRKRKLERISRLEDKVKSLKTQNTDLASTASLLREQVAHLKQKVMSHVNSGCQLLPHHIHAY